MGHCGGGLGRWAVWWRRGHGGRSVLDRKFLDGFIRVEVVRRPWLWGLLFLIFLNLLNLFIGHIMEEELWVLRGVLGWSTGPPLRQGRRGEGVSDVPEIVFLPSAEGCVVLCLLGPEPLRDLHEIPEVG